MRGLLTAAGQPYGGMTKTKYPNLRPERSCNKGGGRKSRVSSRPKSWRWIVKIDLDSCVEAMVLSTLLHNLLPRQPKGTEFLDLIESISRMLLSANWEELVAGMILSSRIRTFRSEESVRSEWHCSTIGDANMDAFCVTRRKFPNNIVLLRSDHLTAVAWWVNHVWKGKNLLSGASMRLT